MLNSGYKLISADNILNKFHKDKYFSLMYLVALESWFRGESGYNISLFCNFTFFFKKKGEMAKNRVGRILF